MKLAIEMGETTPGGYGKIHKSGCRDLRDGMPIGEAESKEQACALADRATCWAENDGEDPTDWGFEFAPCAQQILQ